MKFTKNALTGAVAAAVLATGAVAPLAQAEVSASVGIASSYLWRGFDLGAAEGSGGIPAISGELMYSQQGFYGGTWVSSGDAEAGIEYDLFVGYGMSFGQDDLFSIDVSLWNYIYPNTPLPLDPEEAVDFRGGDNFFDLSEVVVSLGVGPVAFTLYENVAGGSGYRYYTLGGSLGDFDMLVGMHDQSGADDSPVHIDLTYNYNDNLSFTLSQFVADEPELDRLKMVVSYSLPIGN